ncbi:hypothetical protein DFH08DRAFT_936211 [Mycena albidolilacea]|uniref:Uncharacterized protein n=1 Tax=Mycena albidolilacea TaxID=1033008 RepID=A0AAD7A4F8_9AGAR|nr:hypothetical protein DFH08DRAFT_936211 [Mycena albidolilacea]
MCSTCLYYDLEHHTSYCLSKFSHSRRMSRRRIGHVKGSSATPGFPDHSSYPRYNLEACIIDHFGGLIYVADFWTTQLKYTCFLPPAQQNVTPGTIYSTSALFNLERMLCSSLRFQVRGPHLYVSFALLFSPDRTLKLRLAQEIFSLTFRPRLSIQSCSKNGSTTARENSFAIGIQCSPLDQQLDGISSNALPAAKPLMVLSPPTSQVDQPTRRVSRCSILIWAKNCFLVGSVGRPLDATVRYSIRRGLVITGYSTACGLVIREGTGLARAGRRWPRYARLGSAGRRTASASDGMLLLTRISTGSTGNVAGVGGGLESAALTTLGADEFGSEEGGPATNEDKDESRF